MKKLLLCCAVFFAGCVQEQHKNLRPLVSVVGGYVATKKTADTDNPPAPGECKQCRGTGRLGDGTVSVECPVCGGDGTIEAGEEPLEHKPVAVELSELPAKTSRPTMQCKDGRCSVVTRR